jgi:hypothetical protein
MASLYDSIVRGVDLRWRSVCGCGWHGHAQTVYKEAQVEVRRHQIGCPYARRLRADSRLPVRRGAGARKRSGGAAPPH